MKKVIKKETTPSANNLPYAPPSDATSPNIAVVTINYNRLEDLHKTFVSVMSQTYPHIEYIIIDGGSQDGSLKFLQDNDHQITYWVSEPDGGIYDAMNKGAAVTTGDWIIYMNSGDTFFAEDTLAQVVPYLDASTDVVYGGVESILVDSYQTRVFQKTPLSLSELWREMPTCHQSIFVRRTLQIAFPFDTSFVWCADHDLLSRLYINNYRFKEIPIIVSKFDAAGGHRDIRIHTKERWRISKRLVNPFQRNTYFAKEYCRRYLWQNVTTKIRDLLPKNWVLLIRKYRGTA